MNSATRRNPFLSAFMALALLLAVFFFSGCAGQSAIAGIHMSSPDVISVPYGNFNYEGINVTVDYQNGGTTEIPLTADMIPEVEKLKFYKMGDQEVQVAFRNRYYTTMKINVKLNQFKDVYALNGYSCVYDGLPHSVTLNYDLPEGAKITYPRGNVFVNAGIYEVEGILSKTGYQSKTLKTVLTILAAARDTSKIVFEDATYTYDGQIHEIKATGVPEGVEAVYEIFDIATGTRMTKAINAGQYRFVCHFNDTNANFAPIADLKAKLTIQKADYDVSDVYLENAEKAYDGLEYEPKLVNKEALPSGVKVAYKFFNKDGEVVLSNKNAGEYTIEASFTGGDSVNYNPIAPMTAKLKVTPRIVKISDKVSFDSISDDFNGSAYNLKISGELPSNVNCVYMNNGHIYAGDYKVMAIFTCPDPNERPDVQTMIAYLTINKVRQKVMVYNEATGEYDKEFSGENIVWQDGVITATGYDTEALQLDVLEFYRLDDSRIEPSKFVDGQTYRYGASFSYKNVNVDRSVILSECTGMYTYHAS